MTSQHVQHHPNNMKHLSLHRVTATILSAVFVVAPLGVLSAPNRAQAQVVTSDIGFNNPFRYASEAVSFVKTGATALATGATAASTNSLAIKEYGLDSIAYLAAQTAMHSIVRSTVNWINSGFQGSPAFATDLNRNLRQVADAQAQGFLTQLLNENAVHSPFIDQLVVGVGTSYYLYSSRDAIRERLRFTLGNTSPNPQAFQQGDFSQGGWNAWFSSFQNPANNPYGAQMLASQLLAGQIEAATQQRVTELGWGDGFLSWRGDCISTETTDETSLGDAEACTSYEVKTPGSTIKSAFEKVGFLGIDQLVSADEMNEIVGALFGQLVNKMLGSGGVSSLSQPSYGGGTSPLYRATDPGQTSGNTASITATFKNMVTKQLGQLDAYATAWRKILGAAQAALAKCGNTDGSVQATITKATSEIAKTAESKVVLETILADFARASTASGTDQANLLLEISDRYQKASRDIIPTAVEIQEAQSQAEDTGENGVPMSLYTKFNLMATKSCDLSAAEEGA